MKNVMHLLTAGLILAGLGLGGCADQISQKVPGDAKVMAASTGDTEYRTAEAGTIYVYDKTWNKLVYTGAVGANEMVRVEPGNSRVLVDGKPVVEQTPLGMGDRYEILLDPHTVAGSSTVIEKRTVIERENGD